MIRIGKNLLNEPEISVVLPVYNGQEFLKESIESVLAQSFEEFELIIWNDGSEDNSESVIKSVSDNRVRTYDNNDNMGLFATLNKAIKESKGEFIRLWAQDDVMKQGCLKKELEFHRSHPEIAMSYSAYEIIDADGKVDTQIIDYGTPEVISPNVAAQIMFNHGSITANIANVMLRKEVLSEVGLFREDMRFSGDFEMWVRISGKHKIGFIRQPLLCLRSHGGQTSRKKGFGVYWMKENTEIFRTLLERLPKELSKNARSRLRWGAYRQYFHYMAKSFLIGDIATAKESYNEIRTLDNPLLLFVIWLITLNGRIFKKRPVYLIDE